VASTVLVRAAIVVSFPVAVGGVLGLCESSAHAQGKKAQSAEKPNLVIGEFSGPQSAAVRKKVIATLEKDGQYVIVTKGAGTSVGFDSKQPALAEAATESNALAIVVGKVGKARGGWQLQLAVHNGVDGARIDVVELKGKNVKQLNQNVENQLGMTIADPLAYAQPPAPPEPEKPAEEEVEVEEEVELEGPEAQEEPAEVEAPEEAPLRPSPLNIRVGVRAQARHFRYNEQLHEFQRAAPELPGYQLNAAPAPFIEARWYPFAHAKGGFVANLGLYGGYEKGALFTQSQLEDRLLETSSEQYFVGATWRAPIREHEFSATLTTGKHSFRLGTPADDPVLEFPDVTWTFIRLGGEFRFHFDETFAGFGVGYRFVNPDGEIEEFDPNNPVDQWYPGSAAVGVDAFIYAGIELSELFAVLGGFEIRRYAFTADPRPGEPRIVGGGVDEYPAAWVALQFTLPGEKQPEAVE
jgi:hypothetical protein